MDFNIYDLYVDASINLDKKVGCAGMALVDRKRDQMLDSRYIVKENATNNMSEIIAIWMAIYRAIELLYTENLPFHVNIFSDSQISLFGMREWIPTWIKKRQGDIIYNTAGPVYNQEWFLDSYHAILSSGLKLKFWHQKGHVDPNNPRSIFISDKTFRTSNVNSMHMIGTTPQILAKYNNYVDNTSRDILNAILAGQDIRQFPNALLMKISPMPMCYNLTNESIEIYESLIRGGLNYPIYFNGGKKNEI